MPTRLRSRIWHQIQASRRSVGVRGSSRAAPGPVVIDAGAASPGSHERRPLTAAAGDARSSSGDCARLSRTTAEAWSGNILRPLFPVQTIDDRRVIPAFGKPDPPGRRSPSTCGVDGTPATVRRNRPARLQNRLRRSVGWWTSDRSCGSAPERRDSARLAGWASWGGQQTRTCAASPPRGVGCVSCVRHVQAHEGVPATILQDQS
jgi:hypothetical protein